MECRGLEWKLNELSYDLIDQIKLHDTVTFLQEYCLGASCDWAAVRGGDCQS